MLPPNLTFSSPQHEVLRHCVDPEHTSIVSVGSIRGGKTFSTMVSFALYVLGLEERYHHAIVGQSIESVLRSIGYDFIDFCNSIPGCSARQSRAVGTRILVQGVMPQTVWLIGGDSEVGARRLAGATLAGLVIEEMTSIKRSLFNMAFSRLSLPISRFWGNCNPANPTHYVLTEIIKQIDKFDGRVVNFSLDDNPSLSKKIKKRFENAYSGVFHKRMIQGLWAQAETIVWPDFTVTAVDYLEGGKWVLGFDWACSGTLACLAIKVKGKQAVVTHEFFRDGRKEGIINEAQVVDLIVDWFEKLGQVRGTYFYLDPSTPASTRQNLRKKGFIVRSADNAIRPGIITVGNLLARGRCRIHERCKRLRSELEGYSYDINAQDKGEDKVQAKQQDHGCDALRYALHSRFKQERLAKPLLVTEALAS